MIFIYGSEPKSQITLISAFKIECLGNLKEFQNKVSYLVSVYNWVLVVLFFLKKKKAAARGHKNICMILFWIQSFFYHVFFATLELYSECSKKWRVTCQKQVEVDTAGMYNPTGLWKAVRCSEQRFSILKKRATLESTIAVGCYPLTDEPLVGGWTYMCECGSTSRSDFWLWYQCLEAGVANDTHHGAASYTCKTRILKHCIFLLSLPRHTPYIYIYISLCTHYI